MAVGPQHAGQFRYLRIGSLVGAKIRQLRADMDVDARHVQARQTGGLRIDLSRAADRNTELVLRPAGRDLLVRPCIHVWIDPNGNRRNHSKPNGNFGEPAQFGFALDIDLPNAAGQCQLHFVRGLSHTRKNDPLSRETCRDGPSVLAARHDIDARSKSRHYREHGLVRVRLHGVADKVVHAGHAFVEQAVMPFQGRRRIDIERRPHLRRDFRKGHVLGVQDAVAIKKMVHPRFLETRQIVISDARHGATFDRNAARLQASQHERPLQEVVGHPPCPARKSSHA